MNFYEYSHLVKSIRINFDSCSIKNYRNIKKEVLLKPKIVDRGSSQNVFLTNKFQVILILKDFEIDRRVLYWMERPNMDNNRVGVIHNTVLTSMMS